MAEDIIPKSINRQNKRYVCFFKGNFYHIRVTAFQTLVMFAVVAIFLLSLAGCGSSGTPSSGEPEKTSEASKEKNNEFLPQTERPSGEDDLEDTGSQGAIDPFAGPMSLIGVVMNPIGKSLVIIESSNATYIAGQGDIIADYWTVEEINNESVLLKSGDRELLLELSSAKDPA